MEGRREEILQKQGLSGMLMEREAHSKEEEEGFMEGGRGCVHVQKKEGGVYRTRTSKEKEGSRVQNKEGRKRDVQNTEEKEGGYKIRAH